MFLVALFLFILFPQAMLVLFGLMAIFGEWFELAAALGLITYFVICWIDDWRGRSRNIHA